MRFEYMLVLQLTLHSDALKNRYNKILWVRIFFLYDDTVNLVR